MQHNEDDSLKLSTFKVTYVMYPINTSVPGRDRLTTSSFGSTLVQADHCGKIWYRDVAKRFILAVVDGASLSGYNFLR